MKKVIWIFICLLFVNAQAFSAPAYKDPAKIKYENNNKTFSNYQISKINGKYGVYDSMEEKHVISPQYDTLKFVKEDGVLVSKNGKYGLVNFDNTVKIPLKYDFLYYLYDGRLGAVQNRKYGVVDYTGRPIIPLQYDYLYKVNSKYLGVMQGGKCGLINYSGQNIVSPKYDHVSKLNGNIDNI